MKKYILLFLLCICSFGFTGHNTTGQYAAWNPLTDANIIGAYYMNGTGDETDRSGNGNTLTETGTVTSIATFVSGFSGKARSVATATDYLYQADGGGLDIYGADQQFEFGGWFKIDTDNNADQVLYSNYAATGNNRQWRVFLSDSTDTISVSLSSDGTAVTTARSATGLHKTQCLIHQHGLRAVQAGPG